MRLRVARKVLRRYARGRSNYSHCTIARALGRTFRSDNRFRAWAWVCTTSDIDESGGIR